MPSPGLAAFAVVVLLCAAPGCAQGGEAERESSNATPDAMADETPFSGWALDDTGDETGTDETSVADIGTTADVGTKDTAIDAPMDDCPKVRVEVDPTTNLNVRASPNTSSAIVGSLPPGAVVKVLERVVGESVMGNTEWMRVDVTPVGYVSGAFAKCTTS